MIQTFSPQILDQATIPQPSFVISFRSMIQLPNFKFIAPGLSLPSPETFVQEQIFTPIKLPDEPLAIPPVLLFRGEGTYTFDDGYKSNPFKKGYNEAAKDTPTPAGLYTAAINRSDSDTAEEGFALVLPFASGDNEMASKSDGSLLGSDKNDQNRYTGLYQHGHKACGGDHWRAQRLERLFENWTGIVERGLWTIDDDGVVGGLERFKDADTEAMWSEYWIQPDW